jgi:flagellin-specific chaperone FliS
MLIALYDSGITSLNGAREAQRGGDPLAANTHRLKALRVVHALAAGLDLSHGEVPQQIARLCEYMQHSLLAATPESIESALKIMNTLRDAFSAVRDQAAELERLGQIPQPHVTNSLRVTV